MAVYAVFAGGYPYSYRDYSYQKMLMGVHIMKVVVMRSPKAFAWLFRLIFGIRPRASARSSAVR